MNLSFPDTSVLIKYFILDTFRVSTVARSRGNIMANITISLIEQKELVVTSSGLLLILKCPQCIFSLASVFLMGSSLMNLGSVFP